MFILYNHCIVRDPTRNTRMKDRVGRCDPRMMIPVVYFLFACNLPIIFSSMSFVSVYQMFVCSSLFKTCHSVAGTFEQ